MNSFLKEVEQPLTVVDTLQMAPVFNGENSVKTGRGKNGRFTYGNNFSIGNKGGRPKKMTAYELLESFGGVDGLIDKIIIDDDIKALYAFLDIESGKYK